jgi:hypothetical protein
MFLINDNSVDTFKHDSGVVYLSSSMAKLFCLALAGGVLLGCYPQSPNSSSPYYSKENRQEKWKRLHWPGTNRVERILYYNPDGTVFFISFYSKTHPDGLEDHEFKKRELVFYQGGALKMDEINRVESKNGVVNLRRKYRPDGMQVYEISELSTNGHFHGRCTWWNEEGEIIKDKEYRNNREIFDYTNTEKAREPLSPTKYTVSESMEMPRWTERPAVEKEGQTGLVQNVGQPEFRSEGGSKKENADP